MLKTMMMMSIFLLGIASTTLTKENTLSRPGAVVDRSTDSSYAGQYSGDWNSRIVNSLCFYNDGESQHEGTWDVTIASDGDVIVNEFDKTAGERSSFKGFIEEDGRIELTLKDSNKIKGTLEKRGIRLTGRLTQYGPSGYGCVKIDVTLKRK
jgi:hypothetical protein